MVPAVATGVRVYLYCKPVDMRRGFNGLAALVSNITGMDPYSGHVFVFRGKTGDYVKLIHWDGSGSCFYSKRLEVGKFVWPPVVDETLHLSPAQLSILLEGIDWRRTVMAAQPQRPAMI